MSTLIVFGSDGWLGNSLIDEIKTKSLKKYNIKNLIFHTLENKTIYYEKLNSTFLKLNLINFSGDFRLKSTFELLKHKLDNLKDGDIYVIVVAGIIHPEKYDDFYKILPAINQWFDDPKRIGKGMKVDENFTYCSDNNKEWMKITELKSWLMENANKIGKI